MNEERLFRGYAGPTRAAPCACGGFVAARPDDEHSIRAAVVNHQQTLRHQLWLGRRFEDGTYIVGRIVETAEGTFLVPLERVQ